MKLKILLMTANSLNGTLLDMHHIYYCFLNSSYNKQLKQSDKYEAERTKEIKFYFLSPNIFGSIKYIPNILLFSKFILIPPATKIKYKTKFAFPEV
jgi:hypothetical protein